MHENYMPNKPKEIHSAGYHRLVKRLAEIAQSEDDEATELSQSGQMDISAYDGEKVYEPAIDEIAATVADAYCGYRSDIGDEEIQMAVDEACRQIGHNLYLSSDVSLKDDEIKLARTIAQIHEKVAMILGGKIRQKSGTAANLISAVRRQIDKSKIILLTDSAFQR